MAHFREDLAALKAEQAEIRYRQVGEDFCAIDRARMECEREANDALDRGDHDGARWMVQQASEYEQSAANLARELDQLQAQGVGVGNQPQGLSPAKQAWIARRQDLAAKPTAADHATRWHWHLTQNMGVPEDSENYFELMSHAMEPTGYQPQATPDDIAVECGLTADEYNEQVKRLWREKQRGNYPDR
jgi:hypothetical protein